MVSAQDVLCLFCKPESSLIMAFVLSFYLLILFYTSKTSSNNVKENDDEGEDKIAIRNFQTYMVKESGIEPSVSVRTQPRGVTDSPKTLPCNVKCNEVFQHRKLFIGKIEWRTASTNYTGFIKECINPIEMSIHRRFDHPNVVMFYWSNSLDEPVVELEEGQGYTRSTLPISFYCMEFCTQKSLLQFLVNNGHSLSMKVVVLLMHDMAGALHYLHSLHIVHRDLKSDNVMVQGSPSRYVAKLADFDHAVQVNELHHMQFRREQYGTPLYLAPEAILTDYCQPAQYYSHDIYSVGLVMWELFSWVRCKQNILNKLAGAETTIADTVDDRHHLINTVAREETYDVGGYRAVVTCSSTVHIPLLKQICDNLGLTYCKEEGVLRKGGIFFKKGRLIEKSLMLEFYSKNPNTRPCVFRESRAGPSSSNAVVKQINALYTQCWDPVPENRPLAEELLSKLTATLQLFNVA